MPRYTRPNTNLPISLHDALLTDVIITRGENPAATAVTLIFSDGFTLCGENTQSTKKAAVRFGGLDLFFCSVDYLSENIITRKSLEDLKSDAQKYGLQIANEAYGYNLSRISMTLLSPFGMDEVELSLYHFEAAVYEWED